jgi:ribosome-associated protein
MSNASEPREVIVRAAPIELAQFLKFAGLTESGGDAKRAIGEGLVTVNGVVEMQKGKKLMAGDRVAFGGETIVVRVG